MRKWVRALREGKPSCATALSLSCLTLCFSCLTKEGGGQEGDAAAGSRGELGVDAASGTHPEAVPQANGASDAASDEGRVTVVLPDDDEGVTVVLTGAERLDASAALMDGSVQAPTGLDSGSSQSAEPDGSLLPEAPRDDSGATSSTECTGDLCGELDAGPVTWVDAGGDAAADASGFDCEPGASRACADALGACALGYQTCEASGLWSACSIAPAAADSCAPGDDGNCNGAVNEGCACVSGEVSTCAAEFGAFGACALLPLVCSSAGQWQGDCEPTQADSCAFGNDNDCDGVPNEGCGCVAGSTSTCGEERGSVGVCSSLELTCTASGTWSGSCAPSSAEACDTARLDEDCDGQVNEPDACNTAPTISITSPSANAVEIYDGYDQTVGMWYADVSVRATATDAEDGALSGAAVQWFTDQTAVQGAALGSGVAPTVRLYSDDCFGATHVIRAQATDSNGASSSATRSIFIYTLC